MCHVIGFQSCVETLCSVSYTQLADCCPSIYLYWLEKYSTVISWSALYLHGSLSVTFLTFTLPLTFKQEIQLHHNPYDDSQYPNRVKKTTVTLQKVSRKQEKTTFNTTVTSREAIIHQSKSQIKRVKILPELSNAVKIFLVPSNSDTYFEELDGVKNTPGT